MRARPCTPGFLRLNLDTGKTLGLPVPTVDFSRLQSLRFVSSRGCRWPVACSPCVAASPSPSPSPSPSRSSGPPRPGSGPLFAGAMYCVWRPVTCARVPAGPDARRERLKTELRFWQPVSASDSPFRKCKRQTAGKRRGCGMGTREAARICTDSHTRGSPG
ncbi:hypothetical protein K505DRAFT_69376 [Melanomma pulvis-pyrius CBS 109.77]|uniref:Uncharacterized protein n=1 Tax=Melanomma pulvis-pyrius CBS 109.77 TaxID=1314802 RepID=A0A6A6X4A2_9PLEO|nr:hypothetical protein K505DRAFT_69376 [Melanomma pulvis-pyrius CBS 109.77]